MVDINLNGQSKLLPDRSVPHIILQGPPLPRDELPRTMGIHPIFPCMHADTVEIHPADESAQSH